MRPLPALRLPGRARGRWDGRRRTGECDDPGAGAARGVAPPAGLGGSEPRHARRVARLASAPAGIPRLRPKEGDVDRLGRFKGLTTAVVLALGLCAVLDVVGLFSDVSYRHLLQRAMAGASISIQQADSADHRQAVIGWWQLGLFLATACFFLVWFRRAYTNVGRLGVHGLR